VWLLNLDQVEADSGEVLSIRQSKARDIGTSTVAFDDSHVLYSKLRPNLNKVVLPNAAGFCTSELLPLKPDPCRLDRGYFARYLRSTEFVAWAVSRTDGAKMPRVKMDVLRAHCIPLPELATQRRIAAILDKADAIRKKRHEAVELAEGSIRSAFLQLLGNLPGERVSIEEMLSATSNAIRTGPFGSQLLHSEFTESGIPVLGIDNVVTNRFRWAERRYVSTEKYQALRRYRVFPGDVMITIMGTTGRVCIAPEDLPECISTKHLCTITPDRQRLLPEYLWASLLWDPVVRAQATREGKGAIMEGWNMGLVRGLMIKLPAISQQEHFAAFVRKVEGLRTKFLAAEAESNQLFGSLAKRAFGGQL
jgi:type I restriction enzyme S subunit